MNMRNIIEERIRETLAEESDFHLLVISDMKKQGWSIYASKSPHGGTNDKRYEFEKDDVEFEIIGKPGSWEVFTGPTLSGKGVRVNDFKKAVDQGIKMNK